MNRLPRLVALIPILVLIACDLMRVESGPGGPVDAPVQPVRIEAATLAEDGRSVRVDFIGGPEFDPQNPCSLEYQGTAEAVGEELVIGIFALPHPMVLGEGVACDAMGHPRTLRLELEQPFSGTRVRDLAGQVIELDVLE